MTMQPEEADFVGAIIGGQIAATHAVMNRISDEGWRTALEWAERYRDLLEGVYRVNDSIKVDHVLTAMPYAPSDETLDHYRAMGQQSEKVAR